MGNDYQSLAQNFKVQFYKNVMKWQIETVVLNMRINYQISLMCNACKMSLPIITFESYLYSLKNLASKGANH